jgi:hypothetical protein
MITILTRLRIWCAQRLLDLGLIGAANWIAPRRKFQPSERELT